MTQLLLSNLRQIGESLNVDHPSALPDGIHRIDLGAAIVAFLEDKIVLSPKGSDEHYTLHFGLASKIMDIHRTRRVKGEIDSHETLMTIHHDQLSGLLESVGYRVLRDLYSILRPLRIGWMIMRRIAAEPGFFPSGTDLTSITVVRKKRLCVDESKVRACMGRLEYLDDLLDLPLGQCFSLISDKGRFHLKIIGFGIRLAGRNGRPRLFWCSNKDFNEQMKALASRTATMQMRPLTMDS